MVDNKGKLNKRAFKLFIIFTSIIFLMNFAMTFMIASHAGKKEANLIKVELENAKYELDVAMKENVVLKKRIADLETEKDAVIVKNGKVAERKEVKATNATVENKVVKQVSKSKAKNTSNKNIKINPLDVMYHINFPIMYYKDVEADIINGKLKIPKEKKEEPKRTEVSLSNKYVRYDIIIAKAKSYGRDVSYMTYDFLDDVFEKSREYNVNPYVVLGIVAGESNFYAAAKNKKSSATGLGQIVKGTGKYIHVNILGYDTPYNHEDLKDPLVNIEYMLGYFKYLKRHGSYDKAMGEYCGSPTFYANSYRDKLLNNMVALGLTKTEANNILKGKIVYNMG
ncbi:hypothetical protein JDFnp1_78 [Fusobacterium phage JD-Fnp1]|nr:hypothetical protein JDFnp1_78 [Fusobacterium phage JD-Fnp1]